MKENATRKLAPETILRLAQKRFFEPCRNVCKQNNQYTATADNWLSLTGTVLGQQPCGRTEEFNHLGCQDAPQLGWTLLLLCFSSGARIGLPGFAKKKWPRAQRYRRASRPSPAPELVPGYATCAALLRMLHSIGCIMCRSRSPALQHTCRIVAVRL